MDNTDPKRTKSYYIDKYKELKRIKGGDKPLRQEFLKFCRAAEINLYFTFGKNAYSTLQIECGDTPNKLQLERISILQILDQYGELARKYQRIPVTSDWLTEELYIRPGGMEKGPQLSFANLPEIFIRNYGDKVEWLDVIKILERNNGSINLEKKDGEFNQLIGEIVNWNPDRKSIVRDGDSFELKKHLEKFHDVDEVVYENNVELLIDKKYPIEVKKDPTLSEYDKLLGQMIRHNNHFRYSITVLTGISSEERFSKYQKLFTEIRTKLEMTAELLRK